jgi:hypothetical protein
MEKKTIKEPVYRVTNVKTGTIDKTIYVAIDTGKEVKSQCTHSISLRDSYGDGWNGGNVTVYVNGIVVLRVVLVQ